MRVISRFELSPASVLVRSRRAVNSHDKALLDGSACDDASMRRSYGEDGEDGEDGEGDEGC